MLPCIQSFLNFHIDMTVHDSSLFPFALFYGQPETYKRHLGWNLIRTLKTLCTLPWLISGDFNEVLRSDEISSGRRNTNLMVNFRKALTDCNLPDLGYSGFPYTFSNIKEKDKMSVKPC